MQYIETHGHMISRTTDDYQHMAIAGCMAITEPAFWAGWDRKSADSFDDYFTQLTEFESARAAQYGIRHYCWLCLNPKEGEDRVLAREVVRRIPKYLDRPTVLGIGEIGMNRVTRREVETFMDHVDLALEYKQQILIHTPHLEDKYKGTKVTIDSLLKFPKMQPSRVLIDHAEEHTVGMILSEGFYTGLTLYPNTKVSLARAVDIVERYGPDRLCVNSACDWGPSVPLAVPQFAMEMRRRGHSPQTIRRIVFENPISFLRQSPHFQVPEYQEQAALVG